MGTIYIDWFMSNLWKALGLGVCIEGETTKERTASLVSKLEQLGLIQFTEKVKNLETIAKYPKG